MRQNKAFRTRQPRARRDHAYNQRVANTSSDNNTSENLKHIIMTHAPSSAGRWEGFDGSGSGSGGVSRMVTGGSPRNALSTSGPRSRDGPTALPTAALPAGDWLPPAGALVLSSRPRLLRKSSKSSAKASATVRGSENDVVEQVERLSAQLKALERQLDQMKQRLAHAQVAELEQSARILKGVRVVSAKVEGMDRQQLRTLADSLRNKLKTAIVVLATAQDSNVAIISAVTKDLTTKVHAGKLVGTVAAAVGGKGGGRPDMAEAGGTDPSGLPSALENVYSTVEGML